jgi:hypothetical protein
MARARSGDSIIIESAAATDSGRSSSIRSPVVPWSTARQCPDPPGHDRPRARHGLERRPARVVRPRCHQHEGIERVEHGRKVAVAVPREENLLSEPQLADEGLEALAHLSLADEQEPGVGIPREDKREAADQRLMPAI